MIAGQDRRGAEGTPLWLITMTDMYILLMSLFLLLFSLGLADRPTEIRTEQRLAGTAPTGRKEAGAGAFEGPDVKGHLYRIEKTSEGTVITIGGEIAPFAEGSFELRAEHREAVAAVRKWMHGKMNVVLVRGHTAGNWEDSVVLEKDGRVRPFGPQDREARTADPWLLASLRANAVRAELTRRDAQPALDGRRVIVRGDAFTSPVAAGADERARHQNRRVDIVVTTQRMAE